MRYAITVGIAIKVAVASATLMEAPAQVTTPDDNSQARGVPPER